jgi:hypothetical protein
MRIGFYFHPMQQKVKFPDMAFFLYDCCTFARYKFSFTSKLVFPILDTFPISSTIVPAGIGFLKSICQTKTVTHLFF